MSAQIPDRNIYTFARESRGSCEAYAASTARYYGDTICQPQIHLVIASQRSYFARKRSIALILRLIHSTRNDGDRGQQFRRFDRLCNVADETGAKTPGAFLRPSKSVERDCRNFRVRFSSHAKPSQELVAVRLRHSDVAQDDVRLVSLDQIESLLCAFGGRHLGAALFQQALHKTPSVRFVVHKENLESREIRNADVDHGHARRRGVRAR